MTNIVYLLQSGESTLESDGIIAKRIAELNREKHLEALFAEELSGFKLTARYCQEHNIQIVTTGITDLTDQFLEVYIYGYQKKSCRIVQIADNEKSKSLEKLLKDVNFQVIY